MRVRARALTAIRSRAGWLVAAALVAWAAPGSPATGQAPRLAYVSGAPGHAQIFTIRADGTGRRQITHGPGESVSPSWSPDGRRLAFVARRNGGSRIVVASVDGGIPGPLAASPADQTAPAWAPDGRTIAFVATSRDGSRSVQLVELERRRHRTLGRGYAPAWSPDGRRVAFLDDRRGHPELHVASAGGGTARRVRTPFGGVVPGVTGFAWAPDGRRIAYSSRSGPAQEEIRAIDVDAGAEDAPWLATGYAPAWSPDGAWLAFTVARVGSAYIAVVAPGSDRARAVTDARLTSVRPAWSGDGLYLAFVTIREGEAAVHVARTDGSDARRLDSVYTDFSSGPLLHWEPR